MNSQNSQTDTKTDTLVLKLTYLGGIIYFVYLYATHKPAELAAAKTAPQPVMAQTGSPSDSR